MDTDKLIEIGNSAFYEYAKAEFNKNFSEFADDENTFKRQLEKVFPDAIIKTIAKMIEASQKHNV